MTEDLLTTFNISLVARGSVSETGIADEGEHKRYSVPKAKGVLRCNPPSGVSRDPSQGHSACSRLVRLCRI